MKIDSKEKLINYLVKRFGNGLNYNHINYINNKTKIKIDCPLHGQTLVMPEVLFRKTRMSPCGKCGREISNKKLLSSNLENERPDLIEYWHPTLNGDKKPSDFGVHSNKKVWWQCTENANHKYKAMIAQKTRHKNVKCPICIGLIVDKTNNLKVLYPTIAKQWHPTKNGNVKPEEISANSNKSFWWKCPEGDDHEWENYIVQRTKKNVGCPFCKNLKVSYTNSLQTKFPEIAKEWHPTKNNKLLPKDITYKNRKKIWWQCIKNEKHVWLTTINSRTRLKTGCPFCSGRQATKENNLLKLYPDVAKEIHKTLNDKIDPAKITPVSDKKLWWQCKINSKHVYQSRVSHRTKRLQGCPYCANKKINETNSLSTLNHELAKEWHPTKNGNLTPKQVGPGSGKKVWWLCSVTPEHEWQAVIDSRNSGRGCPKCKSQTSAPELRIYAEFQKIFQNVENRKKIDGKELDIYLPDYNIGIEYDGVRWHLGKEIIDKEKIKYFKNINIKVFRVREEPLEKISKWDVLVHKRRFLKKDVNNLLLNLSKFEPKIKENYLQYIQSNEFINNDKYNEYLSYLPNPIPELSLKFKQPTLSKEWDYVKNKPLLPSSFTESSGKIVNWICIKDNSHKWKATIASRTNGNGCPFCSNQKVSATNNLKFKNPELLKEWHPTKNGDLTPEMVIAGSHKKVWWKCPKGIDHEWKAAPFNRIKGIGCPYCASQKVSVTNNLKSLNPNLAKIWHPTKNGKLTPEMVIAGSHKRVWWKCPKGDDHEWKGTIQTQRKNICPFCAQQRVSKKYNFLSIYPQQSKQWDYDKNKMRPEDILPRSNVKYWWKCQKNPKHSFQSPASSLARADKNLCPICIGRIVDETNNLRVLYPELARQWHPTKNGALIPDSIFGKSHKRVWWKCPKGDDHEWEGTIENRIKSPNCPFCSKTRASLSYNLRVHFPKIANEWHPTKNGELKPEMVLPNSHKNVWWLCNKNCGHEWQRIIKNRTTREKLETKCPKCND